MEPFAARLCIPAMTEARRPPLPFFAILPFPAPAEAALGAFLAPFFAFGMAFTEQQWSWRFCSGLSTAPPVAALRLALYGRYSSTM